MKLHATWHVFVQLITCRQRMSTWLRGKCAPVAVIAPSIITWYSKADMIYNGFTANNAGHDLLKEFYWKGCTFSSFTYRRTDNARAFITINCNRTEHFFVSIIYCVVNVNTIVDCKF